jgi:hypothetical protein
MSWRRSGPPRQLVVIATVIAVAVTGSAVALVLRGGTAPTQPPPDAFSPLTEPVLTWSPSPSPTGSPSASPSPSPGRSRVPSRAPGTQPATPGRGSPAPTIFHLAEDICPKVDFTAVQAVGGGTPQPAYGDIIDKSRYVDHFCERKYPKVRVRIDGYLYPDATGAAAAYVDLKRFSPANSEHLDGIGTDAFGYTNSDPNEITGYFVWALEGNLYYKTLLYTDTGQPTPATLRAPTIATAKATLVKLRS